jgi:hypothetical protein
MLDQSKKMTPAPIQPSGRFQLVLSSSAPILLVVPDASSSSHETSIAVRIAHDLHKYHRIDTELITSAEALHRATNDTLDMGNLVIVGNARDVFTRWLLSDMPRRTPFEIDAEHFKLKGKRLASPGLGAMSLLPHLDGADSNSVKELCSCIHITPHPKASSHLCLEQISLAWRRQPDYFRSVLGYLSRIGW